MLGAVETLCILVGNVVALVRKELTNSFVLTPHQLSFLLLKMPFQYPDSCPLSVSCLVTGGNDINCYYQNFVTITILHQ